MKGLKAELQIYPNIKFGLPFARVNFINKFTTGRFVDAEFGRRSVKRASDQRPEILITQRAVCRCRVLLLAADYASLTLIEIHLLIRSFVCSLLFMLLQAAPITDVFIKELCTCACFSAQCTIYSRVSLVRNNISSYCSWCKRQTRELFTETRTQIGIAGFILR